MEQVADISGLDLKGSRHLTLSDAGYLISAFYNIHTESSSPRAAYHDISLSDRNLVISFNTSSLTPSGNMTDDHGLAGLETGLCQVGLIRLSLVTSKSRAFAGYV